MRIVVPTGPGLPFKQLRVARLVAELFVPNPQGLRHVRHKDGNFRNCAAENLEWFDHASRDNRCKMTPKEVSDYVKKLKPKKLSVFGLAMQMYLKGEKKPLLTIVNNDGKQAYCLTVVKNELANLMPSAQYSTDGAAKSIVGYFFDGLDSLMQRGYFLPREDCDDAVYWIYIRSHLKKLALRYIANPRERKKIQGH